MACKGNAPASGYKLPEQGLLSHTYLCQCNNSLSSRQVWNRLPQHTMLIGRRQLDVDEALVTLLHMHLCSVLALMAFTLQQPMSRQECEPHVWHAEQSCLPYANAKTMLQSAQQQSRGIVCQFARILNACRPPGGRSADHVWIGSQPGSIGVVQGPCRHATSSCKRADRAAKTCCSKCVYLAGLANTTGLKPLRAVSRAYHQMTRCHHRTRSAQKSITPCQQADQLRLTQSLLTNSTAVIAHTGADRPALQTELHHARGHTATIGEVGTEEPFVTYSSGFTYVRYLHKAALCNGRTEILS